MDELKEIISVLSGKKVKNIGILRKKTTNSKLYKLYSLVLDEVVNTDEEAINALYSKRSNATRHPYYRLKYQLKQRLLHAIFFIRPNDEDGLGVVAHMEAMRKFTEIHLLASSGAAKTALKMAHKLLPKVEQYEFWDIALFLVRFIRRNYVIKTPDLNKFRKYDEKLKQILALNVTILELEGMYYQLTSNTISNNYANTALFQQALEFERSIDIKPLQLSSVMVTFYYTAISMTKYMKSYQYATAAKLLEKNIAVFEQPDFHKGFYMTYLANLVSCNTYLREFDSGSANIVKALAYAKVGSFNWVQLKSAHVILAFHSQEYEHVMSIYKEVTKHPDFDKVPLIFREIWTLYFAWLYLLYKAGWVKLPKGAIKKKISISTLLSEIRVPSKDKRGLQVNIQIIKTVDWLLSDNSDKLIKQGETLKRFRYRYVKGNAQKRSNLILQYLIKLDRREYISSKCKVVTESAKTSFSQLAVELKWASYEIEILPFDIVVDLVWEIMQRNSQPRGQKRGM